MVPLVLLNSWPAMGCICADGKFSTTCSKVRAREAGEAKNASCSCGTACCSTSEKATKRSCCHSSANVAEAASQTTSQQESGPTITGGDCCQIVWQSGDILVVQEVQPQQVVSSFETAAVADVEVLLISNATCIENDTGQLASDLVVTLRRLLI
jgi:hypothetical protein